MCERDHPMRADGFWIGGRRNAAVWLVIGVAALALQGARLAAAQDENGSIVAWGYNNYGQCNVPAPNSGFVGVAGGGYHSLGLNADGSIVAWGYNNYG